jgi:uncharacterized protein YrrD
MPTWLRVLSPWFIVREETMEIRIGADVIGRTEKLGEVRRMVLAPRAERVVDLIVEETGLLGHERVVPLAFVDRVEDGTAYVDLDKSGIETMVQYSPDAFRAEDPDYIAPPSAAYQGDTPMDFQMDRLVAGGAMGYMSGKPMGYPGAEAMVPEDSQPFVVAAGNDVFDVDGEKIGEIGDIGIDAENGHPTFLTVRRGFLNKDEVTVPLELVRELGRKGVALSIRGGELDRLGKTGKDAAA